MSATPYTHFRVTALSLTPSCLFATLSVTTDIACHLWLRFTDIPTRKHPRTLNRRGLLIGYDLRYCFVAFADIEQEEAGDTLDHTFIVPGWLGCQHGFFRFWGTSLAILMAFPTGIFTIHNPGVPAFGTWDTYWAGEDGFEAGQTHDSYEAQTIPAEHLHHIQYLTLKLKVANLADPRGILTIEFRAVGGERKPSGPILSTATIDTSALTQNVWYIVRPEFDTILCQDQSQELCFQIHGDGRWVWYVAADTTDSPYPGKEFDLLPPGGWSEAVGHTILFKIEG